MKAEIKPKKAEISGEDLRTYILLMSEFQW